MSKRKNPIDRFVYGVRNGFKNIKKAVIESEVIHKCVVKFLPVNEYSKKISDWAVEITNLFETQDVISTDKEFNLFYRLINDLHSDTKMGDVILGYIFHLMDKSYGFWYPKITREQFIQKSQDLLRKPDCDLNKKEEKIMKEVLEKIIKLRNNIRPNKKTIL